MDNTIPDLDRLLTRTIYEPFAWAIFHGLKWYETTSYPVRVRGRVYIHAAAGNPPPQMTLHFLAALAEVNMPEVTKKYNSRWIRSLPRGVILGSVEITDCRPVEAIRDQLPALERAFGDYSDGRFACTLANPILLPSPIPAKGNQGWWYYG